MFYIHIEVVFLAGSHFLSNKVVLYTPPGIDRKHAELQRRVESTSALSFRCKCACHPVSYLLSPEQTLGRSTAANSFAAALERITLGQAGSQGKWRGCSSALQSARVDACMVLYRLLAGSCEDATSAHPVQVSPAPQRPQPQAVMYQPTLPLLILT